MLSTLFRYRLSTNEGAAGDDYRDTMDDTDAVETLTRFGLTTYEARVFLALQKLGSGTASDIAEVTDVPRSQVYGAAESLEERRLLAALQTRPTVYEPVDVETAETRLLEQFEAAGRELFGYIDDVQGAEDEGGEVSEALWTIRGRENVTERAAELIADADDRILYGAARDPMYDEEIRDALESAADNGVVPVVMSTSRPFLDELDERQVQTIHEPDEHIPASTSRVLMVDDDTLLLGMVTDRGAGDEREIALWSAETTSAAVLMRLIVELFQTDPISLDGS
jgi:sugar-specific transcriptional regulator TrmB